MGRGAGTVVESPKRNAEGRGSAQPQLLGLGVAELMQRLFVNATHLGHEKEWRSPTDGIDTIVRKEKFVFGRRADTALHGDELLWRPGGRMESQLRERWDVQFVELVGECSTLLREGVECGSEQCDRRWEGMTATVEA